MRRLQTAAGRCSCGKLCFPSERAAKEVVFEARLARAVRNSHRRREDRYYQCRYGAWHTTSQPQLNARGGRPKSTALNII